MTPAEQKQKAAALVARNKLTSEQIATEIGVCRRTVTTWRADKDFQKLVREAKDAWRVKARTGGPSDPDRRLGDYKALRHRVWKAILARAADEGMADIPGHDTGMVTVKYKMEATVDADGNRISTRVPEYEIDTGAVASLLSIGRQAAEDTGQWKTKKEVAVTVDERPLQITIDKYAALDNDELRTLIALTRKLEAAGARRVGDAATGAGPQTDQPDGDSVPADRPISPRTVPQAP